MVTKQEKKENKQNPPNSNYSPREILTIPSPSAKHFPQGSSWKLTLQERSVHRK